MDFISQIFTLIILSLAVASIAWTVTQEEIFREWRDVFKEKSKTSHNILKRKFFYVFTCEYCFSHWVALVVIAFTGFRLVIDDWRGYLISFFVLPWIANQFMSLYRRLRVDIKHEDALVKKVKRETDA